MTTIGVTGAGGFIGATLIERALEEGHEVRGLDVSEEAADRVRKMGADVVVGDVRDEASVREFCDGCDVVVHTAAIVGEGGDMSLYRAVNVEGSRNVARAAAEGGVERMIHFSSVMVYGFDFPPEVDESGPLSGEGNAYCQTKIESEEAVLSVHGEGDLEVTVVRPGDVYGPGSQPWVVRPLEMMKAGLFMVPDGGEGRIDATYVDNLVDAVFLLLDSDRTGEVFNVTDGVALKARDYFTHLARMLGSDSVPTAPSWLLRPLFKAVAAAFRLVGKEPPATPDAINFLTKPHGYSTEKIRSVGHEPAIDIDEGMRRVEAWAEDEGLL